jgi:hypothetical protein
MNISEVLASFIRALFSRCIFFGFRMFLQHCTVFLFMFGTTIVSSVLIRELNSPEAVLHYFAMEEH